MDGTAPVGGDRQRPAVRLAQLHLSFGSSLGLNSMKKRQFIEKSEGEEYLHKETWQVVNRQFERPEDSRTGAMYDDLVAMVFAFHTLEGYLNFVGDKVLPEMWRNERKEFKETGITGKLAAVLEACGLEPFEKGRRPYSTVQALKKLRNSIAHPKTYKPKCRKVYSEGKEPPMFPKSLLETLVTREKALQARDDVRGVVDRIQAAAVAKFPKLHLGVDGLEGIMSQRSHSAKRLE